MGYTSMRLHRAETLDRAAFLLTVRGGSVLLSEVAFLDGDWRHALEMQAKVHPSVCSIVIAEPRDWQFVTEAVDRGVFGCYRSRF